jgi:hypothetical protein
MTITITLTVPANQATIQDKFNLVGGYDPEGFQHIAHYLEAIGGGVYNGRAVVTIGAASPVTIFNGY